MTGRRLARPFDGMVEGAQSVRFTGNASDGAPLAAGVYWIRLSVPGFRPLHAGRAGRVAALSGSKHSPHLRHFLQRERPCVAPRSVRPRPALVRNR